jgi:HAD superfamily hydrolase (TIGR01509 family)
MKPFGAVLFDFGHTLFDTIPARVCTAEFEKASGRHVNADAFGAAWETVRLRARQPDELAKGRDVSAAAHRRCWLDLLAPLDDLAPGLAEFTYGFESSARGWQPYPDARDVLTELRTRGIPVGVVSDCGWDIRAVFEAHELYALIDTFDLSYEHGICKPDARIFHSACAQLGVEPGTTLMVGDSWLTDGGAAAIGIATLILPARDRSASPALAPGLEVTR